MNWELLLDDGDLAQKDNDADPRRKLFKLALLLASFGFMKLPARSAAVCAACWLRVIASSLCNKGLCQNGVLADLGWPDPLGLLALLHLVLACCLSRLGLWLGPNSGSACVGSRREVEAPEVILP